jgi:hypothetical protein
MLGMLPSWLIAKGITKWLNLEKDYLPTIAAILAIGVCLLARKFGKDKL